MKNGDMSTNVLKRENTSSSANVLMCKQWWKVCWMYGDQEKYYRQLYGKRPTGGKVTSENKRYDGPTIPFGTQDSSYENNSLFERRCGEPQTAPNLSQYSPDILNTTSNVNGSLEQTNGNDE